MTTETRTKGCAPAGRVALVLAALLACAAGAAHAQSGPATVTEAAPASKTATTKKARTGGPTWNELDAEQREALAPLATHWNTLHPAQKNKWLALSRNFDKLSPAERTKLHSRMTDWAALSVRERTQARLNFAEIKRLPADERKAKWEAYQALPPEQKRALAESAEVRPPSAAAPARPVPAQKLAPVPASTGKSQHAPRIELAPSSTPPGGLQRTSREPAAAP